MLKPSSSAWGPFELEFEAQADEIELHSHPVWIDDNFTKRRHENDGIRNGWHSGFIRIYPDREAIYGYHFIISHVGWMMFLQYTDTLLLTWPLKKTDN